MNSFTCTPVLAPATKPRELSNGFNNFSPEVHQFFQQTRNPVFCGMSLQEAGQLKITTPQPSAIKLKSTITIIPITRPVPQAKSPSAKDLTNEAVTVASPPQQTTAPFTPERSPQLFAPSTFASPMMNPFHTVMNAAPLLACLQTQLAQIYSAFSQPAPILNSQNTSFFEVPTSQPIFQQPIIPPHTTSKIVTGMYTSEERMKRIQNYKRKQEKYRQAHPVKRNFGGRSRVASNKPRVKGRFVKNAPGQPSLENVEPVIAKKRRVSDVDEEGKDTTEDTMCHSN